MAWLGRGSLWFAGPPLSKSGSFFGGLFQVEVVDSVEVGRLLFPRVVALRPQTPDPSFARPRGFS